MSYHKHELPSSIHPNPIRPPSHLITVFKPIDETSLLTLDVMTMIRQFFFSCVLQDHLNLSDSALKMSAVISWQSRGRDLELLGRLIGQAEELLS